MRERISDICVNASCSSMLMTRNGNQTGRSHELTDYNFTMQSLIWFAELSRMAVSPLLRHLLRKVPFVAPHQRFDIGRHDVHLAANSLGLARLQPSDAKIRVHTHDHTLEQL